MAMLKNKHITVSLILVCLIVVSPMAKAQLGLGGLVGGLGGLVGGSGGLLGGSGGLLGGSGGLLGGSGGLVGGSGGLLGGSGGLLGGLLASIEGVLFCTPNGNISLNTTSTPAFANAGVELQCGRQNTVVSSTTTNGAGIFSIPLNLIKILLPTLLSECSIVVTTPLASCNATLPSGNLVSLLKVIGSTVSGVISVAPSGFGLIN